MPVIATMGAGSLSYIFTTPPTRTAGSSAALLQDLSSFNFDTDAPRIFATGGGYTESAMAFMAPPDVDDPKLAAFRARQGKLIVYHGNSDPVFSINDTQRWFGRLMTNVQNSAGSPAGGDSSDFARLYGVPGMAHCVGGPATHQFDQIGRAHV